MLYSLARFIVEVIMRIVFLPRFTGVKNIPKKGAAIICANHISFMDPVIISSAFGRPVCYMAKKELFSNRFAAAFLRGVNAFPVDRGRADIESYKKSIRILAEGKMLGMFAQGTRSAGEDSVAAKAGAAMFALKTGAIVVPVGIAGKYRPFSRIHVTFGEPLSFGAPQKKPKREDIDAATGRIEEAMNRALRQKP